MTHKLRHFIANTQAVTSIEYAFLAPIMFLMMLGLTELGMVAYAQTALEGATAYAARVGKTGFAKSGKTREEYIVDEVVRLTHGLLNEEKIKQGIRVRKYSTFSDISFVDPVCPPSTPACNPNDFGAGGDVVLYEVTYPWQIVTPLISAFFPNPYQIRAITAVRNEPF